MKVFVWNLLNKFGLGAYVQLYLASYLKEIGWVVSYHKKQSIDAQSNPLPWVTYPFIHFIKPRISKSFKIFEYGSGNSTKWYSGLAHFVYSVESDKDWYNSVCKYELANVKLMYRDLLGNSYAESILECETNFHIVIVDGRNRVSCMKTAISKLTADGVIVLDNSERLHYQEGIQYLNQQGFKQLDFWGMTPSSPYLSCTTIFYKTDNCVGI